MILPPSKQSSTTKSTAPQPYHCNIVLQTNAVANTRQTVSAIVIIIYLSDLSKDWVAPKGNACTGELS